MEAHASGVTPRQLSIYILWFTALGVCYSCAARFFYVGYFGDDALYIMAARSLLQGHYVHLQIPGQIPINDPLPGYPLLLAPFVKLVAPHWALLKVISVLLSVLTIWVIRRAFQQWAPRWPSLLATALFAFNPLTVKYSANVMSEIPFILMMALTLVSLQHNLEYESLIGPWGTGFLLAWASMIRPQGILLPITVGIALACAKEWRLLAPVLSPSAATYGIWTVRNWVTTGMSSGYSSAWALVRWDHPWTELTARLYRFGTFFASQSGLDPSFQPLPSQPVVGHLVSGLPATLLFGLAFLGWRQVRPQRPARRAVYWSLSLFIALYTLMHLFWIALDERYLLPLLPWFLLFIVMGGSAAGRRLSSSARYGLAAAGGALVLIQLALLFHVQFFASRPASETLPKQTFQWIRVHVPQDRPFLSNMALTLYIYCANPAYYLDAAHDPEALRRDLAQKRICHVLFIPHRMVNRSLALLYQNAHRWMATTPALYEKVYENASEGSVIFQVKACGSS